MVESAIIETIQQLKYNRATNRFGGVWVWQVAMYLPDRCTYANISVRRKMDALVKENRLHKLPGRKGYALAS